MLLAALTILGSLLLPVIDGSLDGCNRNGIIQAIENEELIITCGPRIHFPDDDVYWQIRPWRRQAVLDLVCYRRCRQVHPDVHLREFPDFQLQIRRVERSMFNSSIISCNITSSHPFRLASDKNSSCLIDVVYPAEVESCQLQVHKENWTLIGSCYVTKVYSSAGNYSLQIFKHYNQTEKRAVFDVSIKQDTLMSFIETSSGLLYYSGQPSFGFPLTADADNVTYSAVLSPGSKEKEINNSVLIEQPSSLELTNCSLLVEGGNSASSSCVCRVTSLGSPAGRLVWWVENERLLTGEYGVTQLQFPQEKIGREDSGKVTKCQLDWVISSSASFTTDIAYGPDTVIISVEDFDGDNLTLSCTPSDMHPNSAAVMTWGGACRGQQGGTCSLTVSLLQQSQEEITCLGSNQLNPGRQVGAKWTLKLNNVPSDHISFVKGVGLGIGVTLAIVLLVIMVLLLVAWRRHYLPVCPCFPPTYDLPSVASKKDDEKDHTYTDLTSYYEPVEKVSRPSGCHRETVVQRARNEQNESVYVNTNVDADNEP